MPFHVARPSEADAVEVSPGYSMIQMFGNENKEHPMHCGIGTKAPGATMTIEVASYGFFHVIEGEAQLEDVSNPGNVRAIRAGDIVHFEKGTPIQCTGPMGLKAFYMLQTGLGNMNVGVIREGHHEGRHH